MADGVVNFMIMVYSSKNCGTAGNYEQARVFL